MHNAACVLVGDTAVGKTRLIYSYINKAPFKPNPTKWAHVPSIFCDRHRVHGANFNSNPVTVSIESTTVNLEIWDTFGGHHRDRQFSYSDAEAVVLCFSLVSPLSLQSVFTHWLPEIKRYCRAAPILLVGTHADRRIMLEQSVLQRVRLNEMLNSDLEKSLENGVIPYSTSRNVADQIGAVAYYETSVITLYGVTELFENIARVALAFKHDRRTTVKGISTRFLHPKPQKPITPIKPSLPVPRVHPTSLIDDIRKVIICDDEDSWSHSLYFSEGYRTVMCTRGARSALRRAIESSNAQRELQCLLANTRLVRLKGARGVGDSEVTCLLPDVDASVESPYESSVGVIPSPELNYSPDMTIVLDDQFSFTVHKELVCCRSDVLCAMLKYCRNSSNKIYLNGFSEAAMETIINFLYTDELLNLEDELGTLVLADFLLLDRATSLCEQEIIKSLQDLKIPEHLPYAVQQAFECLEVAAFIQAQQLESWLLVFLGMHYDLICRHWLKELQALPTRTRELVQKNRWPPVWYVQEQERYQNSLREIDSRPMKGASCHKRWTLFACK